MGAAASPTSDRPPVELVSEREGKKERERESEREREGGEEEGRV